MKKLISVSVLLGLVCAASACSSGKTDSITMNDTKFADDGSQIITVATFGSSNPKLSGFTSFPLGFKYEIKNYMPGEDISFEEASHQLDMDVIQGKSPDVLFAPADKMYNYIRKGAMADLFQLMDEYGSVTKDDFLPNVLEGLTVEGELPAVIDSFFIETAAVKKKFAGEEYENWTPEQAMQFYNGLSEDMDFIDSAGEELAGYMLENIAKECIDLDSNTCNFADSRFPDVLRFCAEHPVREQYSVDFGKMSENEMTEYVYDESTRGMRDAQLVFPVRIYGFDGTLANDVYGAMNFEEVTFVGYPSTDGNGSMNSQYFLSHAYGIMKGCSDKESAWKFVSQYLKYRKPLEKYEVNSTLGIPVLKSQFQMDYDRDEEYNNSINGVVYSPEYGAGGRDDEAYLPQEYKDRLRDYIFNVKFDIYFPDELMYMVREEYEPVLAGERTPEQAAEILDSRISTFLSEKS